MPSTIQQCETVPFKEYPYKDCDTTIVHTKISEEERGDIRPIYTMIYSHYAKRKGLKARYTENAMNKTFPEAVVETTALTAVDSISWVLAPCCTQDHKIIEDPISNVLTEKSEDPISRGTHTFFSHPL